MEYITNEDGLIKVMNNKGNVKWLTKRLVDDARLMKRMNFTVVKKPVTFEEKQKNKNVADAAGAKTPGENQK